MLVNLKRDFFGPDAVQYKALDNPHEFSEDWVLPKDAKEVKAKSKPEVEMEPEPEPEPEPSPIDALFADDEPIVEPTPTKKK